MTKIELAAAVRASRLEGIFQLRSGVTATEYFDKYRFESNPRLLRAIAAELAALIPPDIEVLAGIELGGVPIATALSLHTGLRCAFVRKRAKEYGTCRLAEGAEVAARRVLVVEDVVTSGGQLVSSCEELRRLGAQISHAVCVVDRGGGGYNRLRDAGIRLHALFSAADLAQ
jgi:orotate phosphoribosyltransferase